MPRLRKNLIVRFREREWRVVSVNDCRAVIVPLDQRTVQFQPQTGRHAGRQINFARSETGLGISPNSELEIVGLWNPPLCKTPSAPSPIPPGP